ncbi:BioY family transporter [Pullulanibacillus camelliae]|uniref:Biotin transporter n=1 Tax=Pullulanibacillus camelliae TaxID=1707096 RepID=A0A8J2VMW7_9BACL|nr:biotin transporter BioY [Pullulanibacillus camelliae]GGE33368.1 BioY family transporter [Pullulanibacillus camelliae]
MVEGKKHLRAIDMTYAAMFAALMAIGANIAQFIPPIGGVDITLQTFVAILAGALLGSRVSVISMVLYILVGLAGAPVFAKFSGGLSVILSPEFGFLLSFIILAFVMGEIIERSASLKPFIFFIASFVGLFINYVFGTSYMYFAYHLWAPGPKGTSIITYPLVWGWMLLPLVKDIILTLLAGSITPRIYRIIHKKQVNR